MKNKTQLLTIFFFNALLLLISAQMIFKVVPEPPLLEKRGLAPMPSLLQLDINKFPDQLANYVNDHFGFRKLFVRINNFIDLKILHTSTHESVVLGKNDFLFMRADWNSFVKRQSKLTDIQIRVQAQKVRAFQDRLKSRGVEFLFAMAPNKSTIYPELMPTNGYSLNQQSDRERILTALDQAGVNHIDVMPQIIEAKKERLIYYKGDHHWNKFASLIASEKIAEFLSKKTNSRAPELVRVGSKVDLHERYGGGSLDEMLGVKTTRVNQEPVVEVRGKLLPRGVVFGDSFIRWLYLHLASEKLESIDEIYDAAKFTKAINQPGIRYVVVHFWESNSSVMMQSEIWDSSIQ